ncbi:MAG: TetR/AcrR family transcriptional regulator [Pirellulales bacterium]|nr:TetR/AcrR family transcriptional regulator [Pirellulales bacterium]
MSQALTTHQLHWVHPPRQSRSQESLERLLDAAEELFASKGFEQTTIAELVRKANSSVGAFYLRFKDKDAVLFCLHERFCEAAQATASDVLDGQRWATSTIREILAETVPFLVEVYRQRSSLFRMFILRSGTDPQFAQRWLPMHSHLFDRVRELLLARREEIHHPEPEVAVEMGLQLVLATLDTLTLLPGMNTRGLHLDNPKLPDELVRMFVTYLGNCGLDNSGRFAEAADD